MSARGLEVVARLAHLEEREARITFGRAQAREDHCRALVPALTRPLQEGTLSGGELGRALLQSSLREGHRHHALQQVEAATQQVEAARAAWAAAASTDNALERLIERKRADLALTRRKKVQQALDESGLVLWRQCHDHD